MSREIADHLKFFGTLGVDGRNYFDPVGVTAAGLNSAGVGRAAPIRTPVAQFGGQ